MLFIFKKNLGETNANRDHTYVSCMCQNKKLKIKVSSS